VTLSYDQGNIFDDKLLVTGNLKNPKLYLKDVVIHRPSDQIELRSYGNNCLCWLPLWGKDSIKKSRSFKKPLTKEAVE
jgi:hypothetical protein